VETAFEITRQRLLRFVFLAGDEVPARASQLDWTLLDDLTESALTDTKTCADEAADTVSIASANSSERIQLIRIGPFKTQGYSQGLSFAILLIFSLVTPSPLSATKMKNSVPVLAAPLPPVFLSVISRRDS
jgi:hypothetical protein